MLLLNFVKSYFLFLLFFLEIFMKWVKILRRNLIIKGIFLWVWKALLFEPINHDFELIDLINEGIKLKLLYLQLRIPWLFAIKHLSEEYYSHSFSVLQKAAVILPWLSHVSFTYQLSKCTRLKEIRRNDLWLPLNLILEKTMSS